MKRLYTLMLIFGLSMSMTACLDGSTFDGTPWGSAYETTTNYASAIPSPEDVELRVPGDAIPNALIVGETARYYLETYRITHEINGTVYMILSVLGDVVAYPPTSHADGRATWGPFTPALEPTTFLLVVDQLGENQFEYALLARPRNSDNPDDFQAILAGQAEPATPEAGEGTGRFVLDWSTFASMNPSIPLGGQMTVDYSHRPLAWRSVEMLFEDFVDPIHAPGAPPTTVLYRYLENDDTSGDFQFAYRADLHGDPSRALPETVRIRSRWQRSGAGRSDVQVHSAEIAHDLGTYLGLDQDYVAVAECWDDYFLRTYYNESPVKLTWEDGDPGAGAYDGPGQGDPESCVFSDSLFADDDVDVTDDSDDSDGDDDGAEDSE